LVSSEQRTIKEVRDDLDKARQTHKAFVQEARELPGKLAAAVTGHRNKQALSLRERAGELPLFEHYARVEVQRLVCELRELERQTAEREAAEAAEEARVAHEAYLEAQAERDRTGGLMAAAREDKYYAQRQARAARQALEELEARGPQWDLVERLAGGEERSGPRQESPLRIRGING
jgi:hypothetical protein